MKLENDSKIIEQNNRIANTVHCQKVYLQKKLGNLWSKYGKINTDGKLYMKSGKTSEIALDIQKKIDDANTLELNYLLRGNVVWQGLV
jgi:hypothetical protein